MVPIKTSPWFADSQRMSQLCPQACWHSYIFDDLLWNNAAVLKLGRRSLRQVACVHLPSLTTPLFCSSGYKFLDTTNNLVWFSFISALSHDLCAWEKISVCCFSLRQLFSLPCSPSGLPGVTVPSVFDRRYSKAGRVKGRLGKYYTSTTNMFLTY